MNEMSKLEANQVAEKELDPMEELMGKALEDSDICPRSKIEIRNNIGNMKRGLSVLLLAPPTRQGYCCIATDMHIRIEITRIWPDSWGSDIATKLSNPSPTISAKVVSELAA
jgi:hypothetical protein